MRQYNTDDYNALKSSNMMKGIAGAENMRFDSVEAASVFFARELDQVKAKTYDKQYPELSALAYFPITSEVNEGAETTTYYSYDITGMADIINNYATDLPRVDVKGESHTANIRSIGDSYGYNVQEMRASRMAGKSLDARKGAAARRASDYAVNKIAFAGDAKHNLVGIFSSDNDIPIYTLSTVTIDGVQYTDFAHKTAEQILADINGMQMFIDKITMSILYLALEDDYARLQKRLSRMFGLESTDSFYFATKSRSLNEVLEEQLARFVKEHEDARLIIIDTLQKVSGDKFSYASDYDIVTKLKHFSDMHGICLLVVHHTRKLESADSFDMISGTNGLLGAAGGAFVMQKEKRTGNRAFLEVAGRDQQEQRLLLDFDRELCQWKFVKTETELWREPDDPVLVLVAGFMEQQREWSGTATELLQQIPELDMQPNVLTRKLNVSMERLFVDYGIHYESKREHRSRMIKLELVQKV